MRKTVLLSGIIFSLFLIACTDPLDNPVDPEAPSYQGYESVESADDITIISIENGTVIYEISFQANKVVTADAYQIQIADDELFSIIVYDRSDYDGNDIVLNNPIPNGSFFLRVRAHEEGGDWGVWSSIVQFNGETLIDSTAISPAEDVSSITDTTPAIDWADVDGASGYFFEYALSENGLDGSSLITCDSSGYTFSDEQSFAYGDHVYWRAAPVNSDGSAGFWSNIFNFYVIESEVNWSGISPSEGSSTDDTTPYLDWDDISGISDYEVEFAASLSELTGTDVRTCSDSGYQIPSEDIFNYGDICYWHVRPVYESGISGSWSDTYYFNISSWAITWSGISPSDESTITDTTPLLNWDDITDASSYKIEFADSESGLDESDVRTSSSSQYQVLTADILAMNSTCYWRIRAVDSESLESSWSATYEFSTAIEIDNTSIDPEDEGSVSDTTPLLDWDDVSDASGYEIEFATSLAGLDGTDVESVSVSEYQMSSSEEFELGDTVYWRVRVLNSDSVSGNWSDTFSFEIKWGISWSGISPSSESVITDTTPLLNWSDVTEAVSYEIEFANSESGLDESDIKTSSSSQYQILLVDILPMNSNCYWRIRAIDSSNTKSGWSSVYQFSIALDVVSSSFSPANGDSNRRSHSIS